MKVAAFQDNSSKHAEGGYIEGDALKATPTGKIALRLAPGVATNVFFHAEYPDADIAHFTYTDNVWVDYNKPALLPGFTVNMNGPCLNPTTRKVCGLEYFSFISSEDCYVSIELFRAD